MPAESPDQKLIVLKELIESAESSLHSAKNLLLELAGDKEILNKFATAASKLGSKSAAGTTGAIETGKIIEGVFDGQNMVGNDQKTYPVPANYASKSKLIPGDVLKLTIADDGTFIYKQIGPIPRKQVIGTVSYDNGQYKIIAGGKVYNVLLASITYFKAEIGDNVAIIVPQHEESAWAAIENLIPASEEEKAAFIKEQDKLQKERKAKEQETKKAAAKAKGAEPEPEEYTI
ncbi:MAG: hypothetical protein A2788_01160 [Candidatus Abawacabacteria bacterium RIFCSPHIGHO2_01_FULL_46_8]|uniref:50S ribosomal protein L7/L12 n=1 Tax=Candidatus Abawacabacteria bacterium RIFCSPHIGHO2_01_FULL_46_8 TaxID=1817815 RepID=A0A1F4XLI2_9BACT|nr:MAG: hypothetical protein A2788_01160 [Candidatus Abawacabacteria bacterium RIFCSPHIGHO2_01_FULL_46_8]